LKQIIKRNGSMVDFDTYKITIAILSALNETKEGNYETAQILSDKVVIKINGRDKFKVEEIQDIVEEVLMTEGFLQTAKKYIIYREERAKQRNFESDFMKRIAKIDKETSRDNANIGHSTASKMYQIASETSKYYYLNRLIPKHLSKLHKNGDIHIHDLDYYSKSPNCVLPFEYTSIKNEKGDIKNIQFSYFDNLFDEYTTINKEQTEIINPIGYKIFGRYGWTNINSIMRRKLKDNELVYCIKTRKGLPLHLTGNHQIPVIRNNKEELIFVKDVLKGDKLLYEKTDFDEQSELPILDMFIDNINDLEHGITIRNTHKLIHWLRYKYDDFNFKFTIGRKGSCKGNNMLSGEEYKLISEKYPIPYDIKKQLTVTTTKGMKTLPAYLPITSELVRLVGYILAEGHLSISSSGRSIMIANINKDILNDIEHCINYVFQDKAGYSSTIQNLEERRENGKYLNGSVYIAFFKSILKIKNNASEMDIPDFIMNSDINLKGNFIQSLMDSDGYYGSNKTNYCTSSENFANKLILLLKDVNIESSFHISDKKGTDVYLNNKIQGKRNYDNYYVNVYDVNSLNNLLNIVTPIKNTDIIHEYINVTTSNNRDPLDVIDVLIKNNYKDLYVYDLETDEHWFTVNNYIVHNCLSIPLEQLLRTGYNGEYGFVNSPKRIKSAMDLAANILQRCSNDIFGGTLLPNIDMTIENLINDKIIEEPTESELEQACQSLLYNLATMPTRAGNQIPFSSMTFGLEEGIWGRKTSFAMLKQFEKGMGKGETFIFPNIVFKVKEGVNFNPEDKNYDLYKYAIKVSCNRMNPTFAFMDNAGNEAFPAKEINPMGCRSRIVANQHGDSCSEKRGNIFPTTINLPKIALRTKGMHYNKELKDFWKKLNKMLDDVKELSLHRWGILKNLKVKDMPFVFGEDIYYNSGELSPEDTVGESLKHGTIAVGFIGIAECVKELVGVHHGENEKGLKLALEINNRFRQFCDEMCEETKLNWSCYATPAESTCNKVIKDKEEFGIINGVTDKEYYTNSFHIPVYFPISIARKITIEGQFHRFNNAGHISYIELTDAPIHNVDGVEHILKHMKNSDVGYCGINYPKDECLNIECKNSGVFDDCCPKCGNINIRKIRRISGYLGFEDRINSSKKKEIDERLKHDTIGN